MPIVFLILMEMELLNTGARELSIHLGSKQISQFQLFYNELLEWNRTTNMTAITDYTGVQIKHFLDSLTVTLAWKPATDNYVLDIGSGAGLPGLPLKITFPELRLVLLEATGKKAAFLQYIVAKLGLKDVEVINGRAEEIAHIDRYREKFDIVIARAIAELSSLAELALPFCRTDGIFISLKKGDIYSELRSAGHAITLLGGKLRSVENIKLQQFTDARCLVVIDKITNTPDKFPRRPGMPQKNPIK